MAVWDKPIYPAAAEEPPQEIWGELDCVREEPVSTLVPILFLSAERNPAQPGGDDVCCPDLSNRSHPPPSGTGSKHILEYTALSNHGATGRAVTRTDDRARLLLRVNGTEQSVPVLICGLRWRGRAAELACSSSSGPASAVRDIPMDSGTGTDWKA